MLWDVVVNGPAPDNHFTVDPGPPSARLQFGDVTLTPGERQLSKRGQPVSLTPKAFDLLVVLAEKPGRLLTKEQLLQAVWADAAVEESNLSYHIFAIRKALGDTAENGLIETVPKRGYRFTATVTRFNGGDVESPRLSDHPGDEENAGPSIDHSATAPPADVPSVHGTVSVPRLRLRGRWRPALWFAAGMLVASAVGALVWIRAGNQPAVLIRAQISPDVQLADASAFAVSPDGQQLVFVGKGEDGVTRLWARRFGDEMARPLAGTETALGGLTPPMFWSPDSRAVAFDAAGQLKSFDFRDGAVRTICSLSGLAVGGSWNADGVVIVGHPSGGLCQCSAAGRPSELTRVDAGSGESAHVLPWFLPDGRHFLYVRVARKAPEGSGVYVGSLDDRPGTTKPTRLLATGFGAAYVRTSRSSAGHVIFLRDRTLFAQPFDERTLQLRGAPVSVATPVGSFLDAGFYSASQNDVIAFRPPNKDFQLTWFDRQGRTIAAASEIGRYSGVSLSPDGSHIAIAKETAGSSVDQDIWILDTSRATMRRATFGPLLEEVPIWSADGRRLVFTIGGDIGTLFEQDIDGSAQPRLLLETKEHKIPTSASRDGRFLLFTAQNIDRSRSDVWVLPLLPAGKPFPLIQRSFDQEQAQFSPDGRWVAYTSNESGRYEVLVRRFRQPSEGGTDDPQTIAVSAGGGTAPRWRADGKELYFLSLDGSAMAVDVRADLSLAVGMPQVLFRLAGSHGDWDVLGDGSRFLIATTPSGDASPPFTVLWNRLRQLTSTSEHR
jgi:eukaryotic-like serine/threonine-protein kinase